MGGLKKTILAALSSRLGAVETGRWFAPLDFDYDLARARLRLTAPTVFHQKYLAEKYAGLLSETAAAGGWPLEELSFQGPAQAALTTLVKLTPKPAPAAPRSAPLNAAHSFERFISGPGNRLAGLALEALLPGRAGLEAEALLLTAAGPWGKTHLLDALTLALAADPARPFLRLNPHCPVEAEQWSRAGLIIVDDVHFLEDRPDLQQRLIQSFDEAAARPLRLVFSSPRPPQHLPGLSEALRSRLGGSLLLAIEPPEYELMNSLAARRAAELDLELGEESLAALIREAESDPRRLLGFLENVAFLRDEGGLKPAEAVAKLISSHGPGRRENKVEIEEILTVVAETFGLKVGDLTGQSKLRQTAWPRRLAIYLARELTGLTTTRIGQALGGRDHSTVIHALKKINGELNNPPQLEVAENIKRTLLMR